MSVEASSFIYNWLSGLFLAVCPSVVELSCLLLSVALFFLDIDFHCLVPNMYRYLHSAYLSFKNTVALAWLRVRWLVITDSTLGDSKITKPERRTGGI